jgi:hypothetical protein
MSTSIVASPACLPHRYLDAEGRPLVERARPGGLQLLVIAPGPTSATTPGLAVEVEVLADGVQVVEWRLGEVFRPLETAQA